MPYTDDTALLQTIRNALFALIDGGVASYRIGDREFTKLDLDDLRAMEREYAVRVQSLSSPTLVLAEFNRAR